MQALQHPAHVIPLATLQLAGWDRCPVRTEGDEPAAPDLVWEPSREDRAGLLAELLIPQVGVSPRAQAQEQLIRPEQVDRLDEFPHEPLGRADLCDHQPGAPDEVTYAVLPLVVGQVFAGDTRRRGKPLAGPPDGNDGPRSLSEPVIRASNGRAVGSTSNGRR